jgi:hypothetical protein
VAAEADYCGRRRVKGVNCDRALRYRDYLGSSFCGEFAQFREGSQIKVIGIQAVGRRATGASHLSVAQGRFDDAGNAGCDLVLKIEYIFERAVETLGPNMSASAGVDQLGGNARTRLPALRTLPSST